MTTSEPRRLIVLNHLESGALVNAEAARLLDLSVRQLHRMKAAYADSGAAPLAHGIVVAVHSQASDLAGLRLILDAHVSGRAVASALRDKGHDVFAIDEHRELEGLDDDGVLALAAEEERILVTFDAKDFMPLLRQWGCEQRSHAGCVLISGIAANQFGN